MIMIFSIDLIQYKINSFILKCFIQFACTNLDGCQKEGVIFKICFRKRGLGGGVQTWKKLCLHKKLFEIYDDNDLILQNSWPMKSVKPYFQPRTLSEILTITNLWHVVSRIWTCAEPEFRLRWMKLCHGDNCYTMVPQKHWWEGDREK